MADTNIPFLDAANRVHYELACEKLPHHAYTVTAFEAVEALNAPFHVRLSVSAHDESLDVNELLGHDAQVGLTRGQALVRTFCGIVHRVTLHDNAQMLQTATVEIAPALSSLGFTVNTRIFQDQTALDIVARILEEGLRPYNRSFDAGALDPSAFLTRDYCVQYQESDLDFVHRLLEEEGIGYRFAQDGPESVILFDANAHMPRVSTLDGGPVRFDPAMREWLGAEPIVRFTSQQQLRPTKVSVREHDWTRGQPTVEGSSDIGDAGESARDHEVFQHGFDKKLTVHEDNELLASLVAAIRTALLPHGLPMGLENVVMNLDGAVLERFTEDDLAHQLLRRSQLLARDALTFKGIGLVTDFAPGKTFELLGHPTLGFDGEYAITRVTHRSAFDETDQLPGSHVDAGGIEFHTCFECLPIGVAWRPERTTRKPRIYGVQTAKVTGPIGMNVHTDAHGRIKVRFPWDRQSDRPDGHYTAWLRVGQIWAGGGGPGFFFVPRIGMEVIISFLDGDPDRPLVTGCVYNGQNATPGFLPVQATKSIIRTRTVPHSDGHNEISFEDAMGMERVHIRSQRNLSELVLRHRESDVKGTSEHRVGESERHQVGRDHIVTAGRSANLTAGADMNFHAASYNRTVTGFSTEYLGKGAQIVVEEGSMSTVVENGELVLDAKGGVCLRQGEQSGITIMPEEAGGQVSIDSRGATIRLSEELVEIAVGHSTVRIGPTYIQINGKTFPAE